MSKFEMDWTLSLADHSANMEKWWKGNESAFRAIPETDSGLASWLADWAGRYDIAHCFAEYVAETWPEDSRYFGAVSYSRLAQAFNAFDPRISRQNGADQIIIYESALKREAGKRLALNPGKAIRRIIPGLPDKYLEKAVDEFKVRFDSAAYEIKWGETREEFRFAYEGKNYAPTSNIRFSDFRKSLANSCMRHDFRDQGLGDIHPSEVYATPDFRILMSIQKETGKVAARCVVRIDESKIPRPEYIHAPIYGTNDNAMDLLESALSEVFSEPASYRNRGFDGARVLYLKCRGGIVAPYQDVEPGRVNRPDPDDKYLTLSHNGDIHFGSTSGYVNFRQLTCCRCGCDWDEDCDYTDDNGNRYCESCYSEEFGYCEECEESTRHDYLTTVYYWDGNRCRAEERCVCDSCRRTNYTECDAGDDSGDYWADSDVIETDSGDTISMRDYYDNYFTSDYSGAVFHSDERVETEDYQFVSQSEAEEMGLVELPSGDWGKPDPEAQAQQALNAAYEAGKRADWDRHDSGQFIFDMRLPHSAGHDLEFTECGDIEIPTLGGMAQWQIVESIALAQYPAISRVESETGQVWYQFTTPARFPAREPQTQEFANLAECIAAIECL
jgi:hypothetical protein